MSVTKRCTKFRVFGVVILVGVVNVFVFRNFILQTFQNRRPFLTVGDRPEVMPQSSSVPDTDPRAVGSVADGMSESRARTEVKPQTAKTSNVSAGNVTGGGGQAKAGDKVELVTVSAARKPLANVTVPWRDSNSSTPCPLIPPHLAGNLATYREAPNWTEIVRLNPGLEPGGHYQPAHCRARHRVAIIVPYRNREEHLRILVHNLHPMLIRQELDYFVLVVEMAQPTRFNRALLLNIGAVEAEGLWPVQCFIFHDVDLVPENDRNLYTCPEMPRHMSAAVDKFKYRLPYGALFGGVSAISADQFHKVNGYSNLYFGWGGEDDDFYARVTHEKLKVVRYPMNIARYKMIKHKNDKSNEPNPKRFALLKGATSRQKTEGLNSLQYEVQKVEFRHAYTWILVKVDQNKYIKS